MTAILKWSLGVFAFSQAVISATYAKLPDITAAELIEAIKSADSRLVNVETKYIVDEQFNKTIHEKYGKPLKRKLEIHWRKKGIRDYIDVTCFDGRLILGKPFRFVLALNGEIRMQWTPNENKGDIFKKPYIHAWPIPFDFGLTLKKRGKMLGEALEHCKIETLKEARWENRECYYVEAVQPDKARIKAWIDPNAGYRARHSQFWGPKGLIWNEVSAEFKDCGNGVWFPVKGVFKRYGNDRSTGKRVVSCESRLKVEQVKVNADLTQKDFEIQFPHGTRVYVHTLNASYIAGVTSLDDFGEEALNPLVGKPLPELKDLKIDLSPADANDKMILVCFWDMQQRPSRNCIKELAKQAEQLKQRGVTVVAIQASKIDENTLNEWVKKYNIPFPVGMVQGNVEKTRFDWGVRSLPWLILTNWEQTVIAEGFGIDELDEKLKKNIDTEHAIQKNKATPTKPVAQTGLSDPAKSFLEAVEILKSWEDNYAYFKSMKVSYTERVLEAKPPAENPHRYENLVMVMHVERVEQGNRFHIRYSTTEDGFAQPESIIEGSFDGRITQEYIASEKSGMIIRSMIGRNTETMNRLKNYMLLNRKMLTKRNDSRSFKTYWVEDPNSKPELSRILESAMLKSKVLVVSVLPELESIAGQLCHILETTFRGNKSRKIWLAHEKGMLPLKYQRYENNKPVFEIEVVQIDRAETDRGDVWFPKKAYRTSNRQNVGRIKYELTVHAFVPNVKVDDNTFRFDFPSGTRIVDRIRGIWGVDLPKEPPSLVGKPLPRPKDFNLKLDADKIKDKMILVCFWDMEQRPSRACIRQLAKQAQQLKQKGVAVVAIQASKIDENKLNQWVKNYKIPFPVGMVQGDDEKTHFTWGVRSLPWLILTDPDHTVCAEGFNLAELDEKISTITQK